MRGWGGLYGRVVWALRFVGRFCCVAELVVCRWVYVFVVQHFPHMDRVVAARTSVSAADSDVRYVCSAGVWCSHLNVWLSEMMR